MKVILELYYRNQIVDAHAITVKKKKRRTPHVEIHIDGAIDNTVGPTLLAKTVHHVAARALTAAALNLHENPPTRPKGA